MPIYTTSLVRGLVLVGLLAVAVPGLGAAPRATSAAPPTTQAEDRQAQTIQALTTRVEVLERQAQTAVQQEQAAAHRAIVAINTLVSVALAVAVVLLLFGTRGLRDIRRMVRRIRASRDQADADVRGVGEIDLTREIAPEVRRTLVELGRRLELLEELGQPLEAADCIARGNAWYAQEDYARAVSWYDRAVRAEPRLADAHYRKGIALQRIGRREEALAAFDRVIRLDPADAEAPYVKGLVLHELGQFEAAADSLTSALALSPDWAHAHLARAAAYARLGRAEASVVDLTKALALDPGLGPEIAANADFAPVREHPEYPLQPGPIPRAAAG